MKTIKITKADLDENNYYKEDGIAWTGPDFDGSIEIEGGLGCVRFKKGIYVTGSILVKAGSGIKAGWCIKAGEGIDAGYGIDAGWGIKAGDGIVCNLGLSFSYKLFAGTSVHTNSATKTVICGKLKKGTIAYGDLKETGMPGDISEDNIIELSGKKYQEIIK